MGSCESEQDIFKKYIFKSPAFGFNQKRGFFLCTTSVQRMNELRGTLVRTLVYGMKEAGEYSVSWDGADETGRQVPSGIYLYQIRAGGFYQTRKMVLVK